MSRRIKDDAILLSGDGGFLVRGEMTDGEFLHWLTDWVGPVTETGPIRHGWYRWIPDLDEGGVLLYEAKPNSRGAFKAAVVDWWRRGEGGDE